MRRQATFLIVSLLMVVFINGCEQSSAKPVNATGQLSILRISGQSISPTFETTQKQYVSTVEYKVAKISLEAWPKNHPDRIFVNGDLFTGSDDYNLAVGNNFFTIVVKNPQDLEEKYRLIVTRLPEAKDFKY